MHALSRLLEDARDRSLHIALSSLAVEDLVAMFGEMLRMPGEEVRALARAVHAKTDGNPYYTLELLRLLFQRQILHLEADGTGWQWESNSIAALPASTNVVEFLAARLTELRDEEADALLLVACLGTETSLELLSNASGCTPERVSQLLAPALERGVLVTTSALDLQRLSPDVHLRFCHDRMQQAAYHLRDEAQRRATHLAIARRLVRSPQSANDPILIVEHYASAAPPDARARGSRVCQRPDAARCPTRTPGRCLWRRRTLL